MPNWLVRQSQLASIEIYFPNHFSHSAAITRTPLPTSAPTADTSTMPPGYGAFMHQLTMGLLFCCGFIS